jgi:hypothetical protein
MSHEFCEREPRIIAAVRDGDWPAELQQHVAACAACVESKHIAQHFRQAAIASEPVQPQPAQIVWQKLQAQRRQLTIRRATRCMTLMCILAALYAVAFAAWYLPELWRPQLATDLTPLLSGAALAGVLTAVLAVLAGSCYFAYLGSRTDFRFRG